MTSRRFSVALASLALLGAQPASAKFTPPPIPAGFDDAGPQPTDVLAPLVARLKIQLFDPYSARNVIVCQPIRVEPFAPSWKGAEWRPARWMVTFALNSKNRFGGYIGQTNGTAYLRNGEVLELRFDERKEPVKDYEVTLARFRDKLLAACPHISDADYQRAMQP